MIHPPLLLLLRNHLRKAVKIFTNLNSYLLHQQLRSYNYTYGHQDKLYGDAGTDSDVQIDPPEQTTRHQSKSN